MIGTQNKKKRLGINQEIWTMKKQLFSTGLSKKFLLQKKKPYWFGNSGLG